PPAAPPPPPERVLRLPFVGRHDALAQLRRAFEQAQAGGAGGGRARAGPRWCWGRRAAARRGWSGRARGGRGPRGRAGRGGAAAGRPSGRFMELRRERLARGRAPDALVEDSWLAELQRLVPDLHDRYPDLPPPADDAAAGARLAEAVAQLGLALARRRPLLWV